MEAAHDTSAACLSLLQLREPLFLSALYGALWTVQVQCFNLWHICLVLRCLARMGARPKPAAAAAGGTTRQGRTHRGLPRPRRQQEARLKWQQRRRARSPASRRRSSAAGQAAFPPPPAAPERPKKRAPGRRSRRVLLPGPRRRQPQRPAKAVPPAASAPGQQRPNCQASQQPPAHPCAQGSGGCNPSQASAQGGAGRIRSSRAGPLGTPQAQQPRLAQGCPPRACAAAQRP